MKAMGVPFEVAPTVGASPQRLATRRRRVGDPATLHAGPTPVSAAVAHATSRAHGPRRASCAGEAGAGPTVGATGRTGPHRALARLPLPLRLLLPLPLRLLLPLPLRLLLLRLLLLRLLLLRLLLLRCCCCCRCAVAAAAAAPVAAAAAALLLCCR
jgi:hypothetical protein